MTDQQIRAILEGVKKQLLEKIEWHRQASPRYANLSEAEIVAIIDQWLPAGEWQPSELGPYGDPPLAGRSSVNESSDSSSGVA